MAHALQVGEDRLAGDVLSVSLILAATAGTIFLIALQVLHCRPPACSYVLLRTYSLKRWPAMTYTDAAASIMTSGQRSAHLIIAPMASWVTFPPSPV